MARLHTCRHRVALACLACLGVAVAAVVALALAADGGKPAVPLGRAAAIPVPLVAVPPGVDRRLSPLEPSASEPHRDDHVLVGFRRGTPAGVRRRVERRVGALSARPAGVAELLIVRRGSALAAIRRLKRDRSVRYAEPDYVLEASGIPNDSSFGLQWAEQNTGQSVNGTAGTANSDERAVPAWSVTTGSSSVVVAVTDTGIQYTHPDLAANMWSNPGGVGGCPAGTHGFDVLGGENACDPMDDDTTYGGHGTHVAGIIGAVGNNGIGVTGVNWRTSLMAVKWLDSESSGVTSDLLSALGDVIAAKQAGVNVRVVNDSSTFPGTAFSQALSDEIDQLGANNILFVTAAGNTAQNNDTTPRYPCAYDRPTEICVTATDQDDDLPSWANWGVDTVDLAAPGDNIYSTLRGGSYGTISGGSMSAAEVSGAAALILSAGDQTAAHLKDDILDNVDSLPSLSGRVRTGGRLDVCRAMPGCPVVVASPPANVTPPAISGSARAGQTLAAGEGSWTGSPTGFAYQWRRCDTSASNCATIGGASSESYALTASDVGATLEVRVTASNAGGSNSATSSPTEAVLAPVTVGSGPPSSSSPPSSSAPAGNPAPPGNSAPPANSMQPADAVRPANSVRPVISGRDQVRKTLVAGKGSWTGSPRRFAYQWRRCNLRARHCRAIAGATSRSYAVARSDVGSRLEVRVTASNAGGSRSATSRPTAAVAAVARSTSSRHTSGAKHSGGAVVRRAGRREGQRDSSAG